LKNYLREQLRKALEALQARGALPGPLPEEIAYERTRDPVHGDFASNVALTLAKSAGRRPRELAEAIVALLPTGARVARYEVAGPGFINAFLTPTAYHDVVREILQRGVNYGRSEAERAARKLLGQEVLVEFVSANPTGPLHVGHGRGAAYGAAVANLLEAAGFSVHREYYVNDAGRQMDILATSVWLRYLELCGEELPFPSNGYRGDYVWDIAATLHREHGDAYQFAAEQVYAGVPADEPQGGDKESHIDALIQRARALLEDNRYRFVFELALNTILDDIRDDLAHFGVVYDKWYSERNLADSGAVNRAIERLREAGHIYERDGAQWFRSSAFGDEKDRVVIRENGQTTYFASDIAYHMNKMDRGYDRVIDVWGADHHGYVPRVRAALQALGHDPARLDVLLVQFAVLYRGGEKVQMSTRSGEFVTLRQLRREVGNDAARFFYVLRKCEQHLDFDLDLATSQSKDNPVYYVQYAHARICSVRRRLEETAGAWDDARGYEHLDRLTEPQELSLLTALARYPEVVELAALNHEPHQIAHYLRDLANHLHTWYDSHRVLVEDEGLRDGRLALALAARQVLANGLGLLGVSAPESM